MEIDRVVSVVEGLSDADELGAQAGWMNWCKAGLLICETSLRIDQPVRTPAWRCIG